MNEKSINANQINDNRVFVLNNYYFEKMSENVEAVPPDADNEAPIENADNSGPKEYTPEELEEYVKVVLHIFNK